MKSKLMMACFAVTTLFVANLSYAKDFVFSVVWFPAFCERSPAKTECKTETADRFDARHFSLHGLWPQGGEWCGVPLQTKTLDKKGNWKSLPAVDLSEATRARLNEEMPSTASFLERHEWIRHGTCSGATQEVFFKSALDILDGVNNSALAKLVSANIGKTIDFDGLTAASVADYGDVAKDSIDFLCTTIGTNQTLVEIRYHLTTEAMLPNEVSAQTLGKPAQPSRGLCTSGSVFIDAAGK